MFVVMRIPLDSYLGTCCRLSLPIAHATFHQPTMGICEVECKLSGFSRSAVFCEGRQEAGVTGQGPWKQTERLACRKSASSPWAGEGNPIGQRGWAPMKLNEVLVDVKDILWLLWNVVLNWGWADRALVLPGWPVTGCWFPLERARDLGRGSSLQLKAISGEGWWASWPTAGGVPASLPKRSSLGRLASPAVLVYSTQGSTEGGAILLWLYRSCLIFLQLEGESKVCWSCSLPYIIWPLSNTRRSVS